MQASRTMVLAHCEAASGKPDTRIVMSRRVRLQIGPFPFELYGRGTDATCLPSQPPSLDFVECPVSASHQIGDALTRIMLTSHGLSWRGRLPRTSQQRYRLDYLNFQ